jgi:hypothetical protein
VGKQAIVPDADTLRQPLRIAARVDLPVTARSLTAGEMAAIDRRQWGCLLAPVGALGLWLAFALIFDPPQRTGDAFVIAALLLSLPVLAWLATRWRFRKASDYVDPNIVVEVARDGVTIAVDGRLRRLDLAEAAAAFRYVLRRRGGAFNGLVLDLPGRPIALDGNMQHGLDAAAALVAGFVAAGLWLESAEPSGKGPGAAPAGSRGRSDN